MKRNLLITAAAGLAIAFSAPSASAISVEDLDGKACAIVFKGNHMQNGFLQVSSGAKFVKTGPNTLTIEHFKGRYTITGVTLRNDIMSLPMQEWFESPNHEGQSMTMYACDPNAYEGTTVNGYGAACYTINKKTKLNSQAFGIVAATNLPTFCFTENSLAIEEYEGEKERDTWVFYHMYIIPLETNAIAHDTDGEDYQVGVILGNDNTIQFRNFADGGIQYQNLYDQTIIKYSYVDGTIDYANKTFSIPVQIIGGQKGAAYYGYTTYYRDENDDYDSRTWTGYWFSRELQGTYNTYLCSGGTDTSTFTPVTGTFTVHDVAHQYDDNMWAYSDKKNIGGTLKTVHRYTFNVGPVKYYSELDEGYIANTLGTTIETDPIECTHDNTLSINSIDIVSGSHNVTVSGTISERVNNQYIESYDLYLVPGGYSKITDKGFKLHNDKGHEEGVLIGNIPVTVSRSADGDISFNLRKENAGDNIDAQCQPTLYLKANYANGLEPTFHNLVTPATITAIETIEAEEAEPEAVYYNLQGVQVVNPEAGNIYIVRRGAKATKELYR